MERILSNVSFTTYLSSGAEHQWKGRRKEENVFSPQVLRAELRLQELKELVTADWILQSLVHRKAPFPNPLLARVFADGGMSRIRSKREEEFISASHKCPSVHLILSCN